MVIGCRFHTSKSSFLNVKTQRLLIFVSVCQRLPQVIDKEAAGIGAQLTEHWGKSFK